MPKAGDQIGEFELLQEIGRGAVGVVFEARQQSLDRIVAMKFLQRTDGDETWFKRFEAEAAQAARLSHPGILPVYAFGTEDGTPWFAMERVHGQDLAQVLEVEGQLDPRRAAEIVRDAARALDHAHDQGIVHRDVKPANVMLRDDGRVVVTDFGLAKEMGSGAMTTTGLLVGTPYYMSPEVVKGTRENIGPQADVYALGVTLYELIVGTPPFVADSALALIQMIHDQDPPRLGVAHPGAPKDLETLVASALDKDPARRPQGAGAFADELDRFLSGERIETRPRSARERARRFMGRHRLPLGIALVAALLLVGLGVFLIGRLDDQEARLAQKDEELAAREAEMADLEQELEKAGDVREGLRGDAESQRKARASFADIVHALTRKVMGRSSSSKLSDEVRAAWASQEAARLDLRVLPQNADVSLFQLPDESRWVDWKPTAGGREITPGLYRVVAEAPGRVRTIATLMIPPGTKGALTLTLPSATPATTGMNFHAGVWGVAAGVSSDTLQRNPRLAPYYLAQSAVLQGTYVDYWNGLADKREQDRMVPGSWRDKQPPRVVARGLPIRGLSQNTAERYASSVGGRIPTEAELHNAALLAPLLLWMTKEAPADRARKIEAALGREGIKSAGRNPEWARDARGRIKPVTPPAKRAKGRTRPGTILREVTLRVAKDE